MTLHEMEEQERLLRIRGRMCYNEYCFEAAKEYWRRANEMRKQIDLLHIAIQDDIR